MAAFPTAPSTGTSDRLSELSTPRPLLGEFRLMSGMTTTERQTKRGERGGGWRTGDINGGVKWRDSRRENKYMLRPVKVLETKSGFLG